MKDILEKIKIDPKAPIGEAIKIMVENNVSALAVVDEKNHLVGMLSAKDVFKSYVSSKYHNGYEDFVYTYMTVNPTSIPYNMEIHDVITIFLKGEHHYYPVVENNIFMGVLYRKNLLKKLSSLKQSTWHSN